jgi:hypothetical protein
LRRNRLKPSEAPEIVAQREEAIARACEAYRCSKVELLRAIAPDFGKWVKDERLPEL